MKPTVHELKTLHEYYQGVILGFKTFEVRKNDRDFAVGDFLLLREYHRGEYTGRNRMCEVSYVLKGGQFGIDSEHCVMGIKLLVTAA